MDGEKDGWMNGEKNRWMDGWMDSRKNETTAGPSP